MSEFKQVTVTKAASVYFDGKVTSRKVTFNDGSFKTLGIMMPGEYKFGTNEEELMEIWEKVGDYQDLESALVTDAGLTEFDGVATRTCLSIGPDYNDIIDEITGHLKLL